MSADTRERPTDRLGRMRGNFRVWRGQRPFWGGMLTLLAGIPIMYVPYQNLTLGSLTIRMATTAGAGSLIIGALLIVLGLTMWFQPHSRVFAGVAAILLALVSLVVSNFGAFLIGFVPGLIGGALGVAWAPGRPVGDEGGDRSGRRDRSDRSGRAVEARDPVPPSRMSGTGHSDGGDGGTSRDGADGTGTASSASAGAGPDHADHAKGRHGAG